MSLITGLAEPPKRLLTKAYKRVASLTVMCANGTAVAGVNVTGAAIRLTVPIL